MTRRKPRTPLQRWSWERFELKGSVIGMRTRLHQLATLDSTTAKERRTLTRARGTLEDIILNWEESHAGTKIRAWEKQQ